MGFHPLDLLIVAGFILLLFGPKTLQSLSRSAGRGLGQARDMKDKLMSELPVEELSKVNETLSKIPTSPQQVAQKMIQSALVPDEKKADETAAQTEGAAQATDTSRSQKEARQTRAPFEQNA